MEDSHSHINYYEVEPKGRFAGLLLGIQVRGSALPKNAPATDEALPAGAAPRGEPPVATESTKVPRGTVGVAEVRPERAGGRSFWVLVGLAGLILVMIVAVVVLMTGEAVPAISSPTSQTTVATSTTSTTTEVPTGGVIIPPTTESTEAPPTGPSVYTHPLRSPVRIVIPAISTAANIIPVGLEKEGVMQTPPALTAGWYKLGPVPGTPGPAVIIAHSYFNHQRDVFYNLKRLQAGDEIQVYDGSGDVAVFVVDSKEEILKSELPTERIWNQTTDPVIRLVTCGGAFDEGTRHFLANVIIYGHLVE